jgi:CHAT domain-containing protein
MEHLNFDVKIQPGSNGAYPVEIASPAGSGRIAMRFPFDQQALENALLRVQNALLRSAALRRQVLSPEAQAVQDFGQRLFQALMTGEALQLYNASGAQADRQRKGLRVRLQILAADLAPLPWEFLYDPRQGEYLCFLPNRPVVRYLDVPQPIYPIQVDLPLLVLAMVASPSDLDPLDIAHERQRLKDALGPLEQRGMLKLRWVQGQTAHDMHQTLLQRNWHIFHFIGHGAFDQRTQEGVLALTNDQGKAHLLGATDLGRIISQRQSLRLVVLNACQGAASNKTDIFSSTAATLSRRGLPAVLAMQYEITDQAALEFTRGFYSSLAAGIPVDESLTQARTSISVGISRTLEWVTPVLYMRAPNGVLFEMPQLSTVVRLPPEQPQTALPAPTAPSDTPRRPDTQPGSMPPVSPQQGQWNTGYGGPPRREQPSGPPPMVEPQPVWVPPPRRKRAGTYVTITLVTILLIGLVGGAGFAIFKLASGFSLPGFPGFGGSSGHLTVTPTSLTPSSSVCNTNAVDPNYDCEVTLRNDGQQTLNWSGKTSNDQNITFFSDSSGFIFANNSWPVQLTITKSACPFSATVTFSSDANTVTVGWTCT